MFWWFDCLVSLDNCCECECECECEGVTVSGSVVWLLGAKPILFEWSHHNVTFYEMWQLISAKKQQLSDATDVAS